MDEAIFGADNPELSVDWNNLGAGLTLIGHYDEARPALERALSILAPLPSDASDRPVVLASLAVLDNRVGRLDEALKEVDEGIAIVEATGDNAIRFLPSLLVERGRALVERGDFAGAAVACARALAVQERQEVIGADQVLSDDSLTCLGEAETGLGRVTDAIGHLERGLTLTRREAAGDFAREARNGESPHGGAARS